MPVLRLEMEKEEVASIGAEPRIWWGVLLFVAALAVRLYYLNAGLFHYDAIKTAMQAESLVDSGVWSFTHEHTAYNMFTAGLYFIHHHLFGATSAYLSATLLSAFTGAFAVYALYIFCRHIFADYRVAVYSALFFCFNPVFWSATTYAKDHGWTMMFTLMAFGLATLPANRSRFDIAKTLLLAGVCFGLGMGSRLAALIMAPLLFAFTAYWQVRGGDTLRQGLNAGIIVLASALFVAIIIYFPAAVSSPRGWSVFFDQTDYHIWKGYASRIFFETFLVLTWGLTFGWLVAAYGVKKLWGREKFVTVLLLAWMAPYFLYFTALNTSEPRFLIPAFVPLSILMAYGALSIRQETLQNVVVVLLIALMVSSIYLILERRALVCLPCQEARQIDALLPASAVVGAMDNQVFFHYYAPERVTVGHDVDAMLAYEAEGRQVFATNNLWTYDPAGDFDRELRGRFNVYEIKRFRTEDYHKADVIPKVFDEKFYWLTSRELSKGTRCRLGGVEGVVCGVGG